MLVNKEVVHPVLLIVLHLAESKNKCFVSKPFKVKTCKPMYFAIQSYVIQWLIGYPSFLAAKLKNNLYP